MKIVHVVDSMEVGGAEVLVSQMCREQRQMGHDPSVLAVLTPGPLGAQLRAEGFSVQANVGRHLIDSTIAFYRIFRGMRPDVVHLHNPTPTVYAGPAARFAAVPTIVSTRHSLVGPPHRKLTEIKYAVAARFCDYVIGICDATVNNLSSLHTVSRKKLTRIYNGANPITIADPSHHPLKSGFTLLYVGRLAPIKNLPVLLHAFSHAHASNCDLRLWLVGDGPERAHLESLATSLNIENFVTFWGQQLDVAPYYSAADIFVMSSDSEGLPISLLQAFSVGLPAVVTDAGGMAESVRLANAGIVVPLKDSDRMAEAILQLAENDGTRADYRTAASSVFQSHFTLHTMVEGYIDLYTRSSRSRASDQ